MFCSRPKVIDFIILQKNRNLFGLVFEILKQYLNLMRIFYSNIMSIHAPEIGHLIEISHARSSVHGSIALETSV